MNTQEAYEKMREWFSRPDAVFGWGILPPEETDVRREACVYRGDGDPKSPVRCAFGCLIPDELYKPEFENVVASILLRAPDHPERETLKRHFQDVDKAFLDQAQTTHDRLANERETTTDDFVRELDTLAKSWGLQVVKGG